MKHLPILALLTTVLASTLIISPLLAQAGSSKVLVVQSPVPVQTLDPGQAYDGSGTPVLDNLYETLLRYSNAKTPTVVPQLASSFEVLEAGRQYVFTLREGVKFHSGNTMTCADAEYSFRRALITNNPNTGNAAPSMALLGISEWTPAAKKSVGYAQIERAVSCDASNRLVLRLSKPNPSFATMLPLTGLSILDKQHMIAGEEWSGTSSDWQQWIAKDATDSYLSQNPSGTGAYKFAVRTPDRVVCQAFSGYWGGQPPIPTVIYQLIENPATSVLALKKGDADFVMYLDRDSLKQFKGDANVVIYDDLPSPSAPAVFFNRKINGKEYIGSGKLDGKGIPPNFFTDINVREAFTYSFDPRRFIKEIQGGKGKLLTMPLPANFPGYDATIPTYAHNPEKATAAFKKAFNGELWKRGFVLRVPPVGGNPIPTILKQNIEALNPKFKVVIVNVTAAQYAEQHAKGAIPLVRLHLPADYADTDYFLRTFFSNSGGQGLFFGASDPILEALIDKAQATSDPVARTNLHKQVGRHAAKTFNVLNLPVETYVQSVRKEVKGFQQNYNQMVFSRIFWKDLSK
jgi:peptide/nickel transport system substrate-binding protein